MSRLLRHACVAAFFALGACIQVGTVPDAADFYQSGSAATALLRSSLPLAWLHVPKAGSSFGNSLIHTPGVCPGVSADAVINRTTSCQDCNDFNDGMLGHFAKQNHMQKSRIIKKAVCPGLAKWGYHHAIGKPGEFTRLYKGKGVVMIRQPEQRMISSYEHNQHDWFMFPPRLPASSLAQYAQETPGCQVRMLTRADSRLPGLTESNCGEMSPLTHDDVELAKERLQQFAFVGLSEEWDLSICLYRTMFGGECQGSDFGNTRLPKGEKSAAHDTSVLGGWVDPFDGPLYVKAREIFAAELQRYGVNEASCKPCWDNADMHWTVNT